MAFGRDRVRNGLRFKIILFRMRALTGIAVFSAVAWVMDAVIYDGIHTRAIMNMMWQLGLGVNLTG